MMYLVIESGSSYELTPDEPLLLTSKYSKALGIFIKKLKGIFEHTIEENRESDNEQFFEELRKLDLIPMDSFKEYFRRLEDLNKDEWINVLCDEDRLYFAYLSGHPLERGNPLERNSIELKYIRQGVLRKAMS